MKLPALLLSTFYLFGALPPSEQMQQDLQEVYNKYQTLNEGQVASYTPSS